jgi:MFS family permease
MRRGSSPSLPLYVGGFIGPFGGAIIAVLIPQIRDAFDTTTGVVAAAIPAYLVPFAVLQLVSGTIGERLGRRRVVRGGYIAYALFSVAAALAPSIGVFMASRALQGAANAFLTPLLMAGLADAAPPERIGRSVGTFAAVQTAAIALSPLCGGLLGEADWRLAFLVPAGVAAALVFFAPSDATRDEDAAPARQRAVFTRRVGLLSAAAFLGYAGITGLGFLVAIRLEDAFDLGSSSRGVVLATFGVAGMLLGRSSGHLVDRHGRVPVAVSGALLSAVMVALIGEARSAGLTAALWFGAGASSTLVWAAINTLAIESVPGNRAGATSVVSAFKFAGNAAAPALWLPLYYEVDVRLAFIGAGVLALLVGGLTLRVPQRT